MSGTCQMRDLLVVNLNLEHQKNPKSMSVAELEAAYKYDFDAGFDCDNATPEQRQAGACINGLLATAESQAHPGPNQDQWLIQIWQAAANKYQVPWQIIAAVNAARSDFGQNNCLDANNDSGFYRLNSDLWAKDKLDGGQTTMQKSNGSPKGLATDSDCPKPTTKNRKVWRATPGGGTRGFGAAP